MRIVNALLLSAAVCLPALAQSNWDKSYNVSGKAALQVEVDDASVRMHACGGCRSVRIHIEMHGGDLSHWRLTELQGGDGVHFALKHKQGEFNIGWHMRQPEVIIETPTETQLNVRSGDGSLAVAGVHGPMDMRTGDGSVQVEDANGALRIGTGDGSVHVSRSSGTLNATTGDGSMMLEGRFSQLEARTGDGSVIVTLLPGSQLAFSSSVTTGDGSIAMRVPRDLHADVQASSGGGNVAVSLPLQTNGTNGRNNVHGMMNGGGPTLRVHSGDGSIALASQ